MATTIGLVAAAAVIEAGYNLAKFVSDILHLPGPLAVMFPLILEAVAATFALQDLRDRRQGHDSTAMRVATYLTLVGSSVINGIVGVSSYEAAGLLEVLPPLVLAAVIHLHGDRATRAHHSRAVLSEAWRTEQLRAAQVASVAAVLPLLAGDDEDGRATVTLLRGRLESRTLEPGEALIAAGWHDRHVRTASASRLRRLETVAATVWGADGAPTPPPPPHLEPAPEPEPAPATPEPSAELLQPTEEQPQPLQEPTPARHRRPAKRQPRSRQTRPKTQPAAAGNDDILLPVAREVAREITARGERLTRDNLVAGIRGAGHSCDNARGGHLLKAIRDIRDNRKDRSA